jgi:hypothetical protein
MEGFEGRYQEIDGYTVGFESYFAGFRSGWLVFYFWPESGNVFLSNQGSFTYRGRLAALRCREPTFREM